MRVLGLKGKNNRRIVSLCIFAIVLIFGAAFTAEAACAYTTDSYDIDVQVSEDNSCLFAETVKVNYDSPRHGIYRYVPMTDMEGNTAMKIDKMWVDGWDYETYDENGCRVFKIGSGDTTVTGPQTFRFGYRVRMYDDMDTSSDLFYMDLLPTEWETAIKESNITVTFPKAVDKENIKIYAAEYGSDDVSENISWSYDEASRTVRISGRNLEKGVGITMKADLPEGYWVGQMNREWMKPASFAALIAAALITALLWFLFGRDKKIVETVEFYPPEGLTPAEVGLVIDGTADKKDLISMIIYFAGRGYLSIEQYKKKKFRLRKLQDIDQGEKLFARTLFDGLFKTGDQIDIYDLGEEFGDAYLSAYEELKDLYRKKRNLQFSVRSQACAWIGGVLILAAAMLTVCLSAGYNVRGGLADLLGALLPAVVSVIMTLILLRADTKKYTKGKAGHAVGNSALWIADAAFTAVGGFFIGRGFGSALIGIAFTVCILAAQFFTVNMLQRTDRGIELMGKILGLKNFIKAAELDRINSLVEENPSYYYDILPYAFVMGLTDKWAKNFENIRIEAPDWYQGYEPGDTMFNVWMFSNMINSFGNSVSNSVMIPIGDASGGGDLGGGGFGIGGGGFSGGGFGGGGGGSW